MTYFNTPFKYGRKTKAEIDAISTSGLQIGDNVFNTDINKEEFWTGTNWINDDCIEVKNTEGSNLSLGDVVCLSPYEQFSTEPCCIKANYNDRVRFIGVIYRGGTNNSQVVVATKGKYKVKFNSGVGSVTRQNIAQIASFPNYGEVISTGSKTGSFGSIGTIAESYAVMPVDYLVYCWIGSAEAF